MSRTYGLCPAAAGLVTRKGDPGYRRQHTAVILCLGDPSDETGGTGHRVRPGRVRAKGQGPVGAGHRGLLPVRGGWHIQGRVAVEESPRLEPERGPVHRHHRPVLGPGDVVQPEHMPEHHVGALDGPVGGRPGGQASVAGAQVGELAAGPPLVVVVLAALAGIGLSLIG